MKTTMKTTQYSPYSIPSRGDVNMTDENRSRFFEITPSVLFHRIHSLTLYSLSFCPSITSPKKTSTLYSHFHRTTEGEVLLPSVWLFSGKISHPTQITDWEATTHHASPCDMLP